MQHLSLPDGRLKLVCIAAHPDDIEIAAGATLLGLAERGAVEGHWLTLTGSPQRRAEAAAAAKAFLPDSQSSFHAFPDGRLPAHWNEVKDALRSFADAVPDADVVLAPRMDDAHQDHRLLGTMTPTVWRDALVLHYEIPKWDGDLGAPNLFVPATEADAERKIALLMECFASQRDKHWFDEGTFRGLMRLRGLECAAESGLAEGFHARKLRLG